jgi:hypothetical protein
MSREPFVSRPVSFWPDPKKLPCHRRQQARRRREALFRILLWALAAAVLALVAACVMLGLRFREFFAG